VPAERLTIFLHSDADVGDARDTFVGQVVPVLRQRFAGAGLDIHIAEPPASHEDAALVVVLLGEQPDGAIDVDNGDASRALIYARRGAADAGQRQDRVTRAGGSVFVYDRRELPALARRMVDDLSPLVTAVALGTTLRAGDPQPAGPAAEDDTRAADAGAPSAGGAHATSGIGPSAAPSSAVRLAADAPLKLPCTIGPFTVVRALGRGGMGVVYEAEQEHLGRRPVALKLLRPGKIPGTRERRFEFEWAVLARIQHPNVVTLYDAGKTDDGTMFMAMERVYGPTLLNYCDNQRIPVEQRVELFAQLCDGVAAIHGKGVIHRNLTPHNVLVTTLGERPVVKILDFGIAKTADHRDPLQGPPEREGQLYGSLAYMGPEQATGSSKIDTRADIYALGIVLYELLTGHRALSVKPDDEKLKVKEVIERILKDQVPPPSYIYAAGTAQAERAAEQRRSTCRALAKLLRGALDEIVLSCVQKASEQRYAAAHEVARDIRAWKPRRGLLS
jgi:serine/threonine protein kinase